jgi:hypothetical protein
MSQNENKPIDLGVAVPHIYVQRPYFSTMCFKLVYDVRSKDNIKKKVNVWGMSADIRRQVWYKGRALAGEITKFCKKDLEVKIRTRSESSRVSIFLEDEADARAVVEKFKDGLIEVHVPYNVEQIKIADSDMMGTPLFRAKLFEQSRFCKGYRYKVQVRATSEVKSLRENLIGFFANLDRKDYFLGRNTELLLSVNSKKQDLLSWWNTLSMYFNDERDLLMLKLMIGASEMTVYKVILHKELLETDK